jgi:predicted neuraminidase
MKSFLKIGMILSLVILLVLTSASSALSQTEAGSWIKRRLTNNAGDSRHPSIAVSGSNIHVVWRNWAGNNEIFYKRSTDNGSIWSVDKNLSSNTGHSLFPSIAVSGENIYVVWHDYTLGNAEIFFKFSTDNASTWSSTKRLTDISGFSAYPSITVSGENIHVAWYDGTPQNGDVFYMRSTDNGSTWSVERNLTSNAGKSFFPSIVVSGDNVHLIWADFTPGNGEIFYKRSLDNGVTWSKERRLTHNRGGSVTPSITVSGNNVHVTWRDKSPGNAEIFYKCSTNNGDTWSNKKRLTKNAGSSTYPSIAVIGDNVHVTWNDNSRGNYEIFYKHSTNNGSTWSMKTRLTHNAGDSLFSSIAVSGDNVHVAWTDFTPGNGEILYKRGQ